MIDTSEIAKLADDIAGESRQVDDRAQKAVGRATDFLYHLSKVTAPVETGELKASIRKDTSGLVRRVYTDDVAAIFQEFGTSRHAPQPFLIVHSDNAGKRLMAELEREGWDG